jgi:hypothetical protein
MNEWVVPVVSLVAFIVLLVPASRLVQRATGRRDRLGGVGLVTLAGGVFVSMMLLGAIVPLPLPWSSVAAGAVAGLWCLVAQALFGEKIPSRVGPAQCVDSGK